MEFAAAVALLLVPVVLLVAALPTWSEREHAATVAAQEGARQAVAEWPAISDADVVAAAQLSAVNLGVPARDVSVRMGAAPGRGGQVRVTVTIVMPTLVVPGIGRHGAWHWTTSYAMRIDDYRSA